MPDLISHAASVYIFRDLFSKLRVCKSTFVLILLGAILPDVISRGAMVLAPAFYFPAQFFHTPLACLLQTIFISCFFVREQRLQTFNAITLGWIIHQCLDLFQFSLDEGGYYVFWPFYHHPVRLGLFWVEDWPIVAVGMVLVACITGRKIAFRVKQRVFAESRSSD
jgi:hypothetical protein